MSCRLLYLETGGLVTRLLITTPENPTHSPRRPLSLIARLVRISLALAVITFGTALLAQVQNGGFETGDFTDWTVSGDTSFVGVCNTTTCPDFGIGVFDGTYSAYFGPVGDTATISQEIPTTVGPSTLWISTWLILRAARRTFSRYSLGQPPSALPTSERHLAGQSSI